MSRTAMVAGATGLVGNHCLRLLAASPHYAKVVALARRPLQAPPPGVVERSVDFDRLTDGDIEPGADLFSALGTTIRKAGSQAAFRRVDLDYPLALARLAASKGASRLLLVSSVGADPASANFYLRVKGELEHAVQSLPFEAVHIFRPSLLLGERQEIRLGERLAIAAARSLQFGFVAGLRKYHPVLAASVAAAMVRAALRDDRGVHIHHYDEIMRP
ncbi:MAG: oxidoreductase [Bryobacteraceae bacterium]|nr:oxidoreductase [Bryobacteraceae bacterium]